MRRVFLALMSLLCLPSCSTVGDKAIGMALAIKGRKPAEWRLVMTVPDVYDEEVVSR